MTASWTKALKLATGAVSLLVVFIVAWHSPQTLTDIQYLGAFLALEIMFIAIWHYERVIFPLLAICFLWAGTSVPLSSVGGIARWVVLAAAALFGLAMWLRKQEHKFTAIHFVASCCVGTAVASAAVSDDPKTSLLKAVSFFLLFLYGATGARLAFLGREVSFVKALVLLSEGIVWVSALSYMALGLELFGNPNSLGAVMAVLVIPILVWGVLIADTPAQKYRRATVLVIAGGLLYYSLSRASMLAAAVVVVVLCAGLRRQMLFFRGAVLVVVLLACAALMNPSHFDEFLQSLTSKVLYKEKDKDGILGSRRSPWQDTVSSIKQHPLLGTGFGTSYMGESPLGHGLDVSSIRTRSGTNREHGNSYLALAEYIGLVGVLPFIVMFILLGRMIIQVWRWLRQTSDPHHCAVPLAMVLLAGLIHAFFEDWLFAVGYYLCVFFWTSAFLLSDLLPTRVAAPRRQVARPLFEGRTRYGIAAPIR